MEKFIILGASVFGLITIAVYFISLDWDIVSLFIEKISRYLTKTKKNQ